MFSERSVQHFYLLARCKSEPFNYDIYRNMIETKVNRPKMYYRDMTETKVKVLNINLHVPLIFRTAH